jgi:hypothetical protein
VPSNVIEPNAVSRLIPNLQLIASTIEQPARLTRLPSELILQIFEALESDPIGQITLAMSCKKLLGVSQMITIHTCCLAPGSIHRALLLCYIHPRVVETSPGASSSILCIQTTRGTLAVPPGYYNLAPRTANLSPDWHICGPCGKLRPTSVTYWEDKRMQHGGMYGFEYAWNVAAAKFSAKVKVGPPDTKCPECEVAELGAFDGSISRGVSRARGGFRVMTWRDVLEGSSS